MSTSSRPSNHPSSRKTPSPARRSPRHGTVPLPLRLSFSTMLVTGIAFITLAAFGSQSAVAATAVVNLGTSSTYAVLAGSAITNTGPTTIHGDIGISPGSAVTGFPPGMQPSGTTHVADGAALLAKTDLGTASVDAAGRTPFVTVSGDLGGTTLVAGVYHSTSSIGLTGAVTLNGAGDASSVFIFQAGSTLTTASSSSVVLENGAQACNVFWQVGSSATLGTTTNFAGTIIATTSITLDTGATVNGRALALGGAVTMDANTITVPTCNASSSTTTTTVPSTTTTAHTTTTTTHTTSTTIKPGSSPGSSSTTTPTIVVPVGAPATGAGGTARNASTLLLPLGLIALGLAGVAGRFIMRARRIK